MAKYLELTADFTASGTAGTSLVLVNGSTTTGYKLRKSFDLGSPVERPMFSRTIDSFGVRVTGASLDAREVQIPLRVEASTVAQLQTYLDALFTLCADISHYGGGKLNFRSGSGTYTNTYRVAQAQCQAVGAVHEYDAFLRQYVTIALTVDPYGLSDPYDIFDDFSTNTLGSGGRYNKGGADWTDSDAISNTPTIAGGVLTTTSTTGQGIYRHTGTPHGYRDVQVTIKGRLNTTNASNKFFGILLKYVDANNFVYIRALGNGAGGGTLGICSVVGGTTTVLASTAITTETADVWYWLRARIEDNTITAEWWATEPTPTGTPTHSTSTVLSATNVVMFGRSATASRVGISWNTQGSNTISFDDFKVEACSYRSWSFPDILPLNANWGGTTDAQAGVYFTNSSTAPTWMLYSWWAKPGPTNLVTNGGAENIGNAATGAGSAYGWVATAVAGVTGAATSIERTTTAASVRTGAGAFEIVCPATSDTGASFAIYHRFKKGVTYVATCWMRSAAGTTVARVKLGVSGDVNASGSIALSTTWSKRAIMWTPTADRDVAYFVAGINAATATTWNIDDVQVYEAGPLKDQYTSNTLDNPVFYARLGESSGNVTDVIGSRTGTVAGTPTYGNIGPIPGDSTTCMDFDSASDTISFPYESALNPSIFTCEAWAMADAGAGTFRTVVSARGTGTLSGFLLAIDTSDLWIARLYDAGGTSAQATAVTATIGQWFHIVETYDGTTLRLYVDGRLVGISVDTFVPNPDLPTYIGSTAGTNRFRGKIANVRLYDRCLTGDEILRRAQGAPPTLTDGAFGPGVVNGANFDQAKASLSSDGLFFGSPATDANYRSGYEVDGSGSMTTQANLEYFIRPDLFVPDDFTQGEVEVAVFARGEVASTQTSLNCAISCAPEGGTSFGSRIYSGFRSTGKTLTLPASGTRFKPYYLGKLTMRVDRANPVRWKLRLSFTNSVSATGTFGLDYLIVVPWWNIRQSASGDADADIPDFIASTSQTTKLVRYDGSSLVFDQTTAGVNKAGGYPDEGLAGENILLDRNGAELLVWPSDQPVDMTDSSAHSMALAHTGTVQVNVQPQHHVLRQA